MAWKIFAVALAASLAMGLGSSPRDLLDVAGRLLEPVATAGVLAYAFRLDTSWRRFWTGFPRLFAAWSAVVLAVGAIRGAGQGLPPVAIGAALAMAAAWLVPAWVALRRLARAAG